MLREFVLLVLTNAAAGTMGASEQLFQDQEKRQYNFGLGKRAYSYVSEYKRLPVYNFGLGKRADARNAYSFGLGKRAYLENDQFKSYYDDEDDSSASAAAAADLYSAAVNTAEKRAKNYNFGLGKRLSSPAGYNFGLGKKAATAAAAFAPHYSFGLGKRLGQYNFGLGKRQGKYSFGLGKKDKVYSFGLGKRFNSYLPADQRDEFDYDDRDRPQQEEKRNAKYSFGLGKRSSYSGGGGGGGHGLEETAAAIVADALHNSDGVDVDADDDVVVLDEDDQQQDVAAADDNSAAIHSETDARGTRYTIELPALKSVISQSKTKANSQSNDKKF